MDCYDAIYPCGWLPTFLRKISPPSPEWQCQVSDVRFKVRIPTWVPKRRWEDNIKMGFSKVDYCGGVNSIDSLKSAVSRFCDARI
jgi:hypothetical protein